MVPTLHPGDLLWVRKPDSLMPGQIIVFRHDQGLLIKRIVELPGEPIAPGTFFVLGDARDDSLDSRRLGPITVDRIVGAAICRLWPPPFAL